MVPKFILLSDGSPAAWWEDPMAPEAIVASFLRSEIGFQLSNVDEFLRAIDEWKKGELPRGRGTATTSPFRSNPADASSRTIILT